MAKIDLIRQVKGPQTASVYVRTTAVTSSLTGEYDLEFVPITGISASVDGPAISGSLSKAHLSSKVPNLVSGSAQVKSLLPAGSVSSSAQISSLTGVVSGSAQIATDISGAFSAPSASFSTRLTTAETELSLTLLSGSAQVKSLLPAGTVSSSAQISNLTGVVSAFYLSY